MEVFEKLIYSAGEEPRIALDKLTHPVWDAPRFHWEYYVNTEIRGLWSELPFEAKAVAYIYAVDAASSDEPDIF